MLTLPQAIERSLHDRRENAAILWDETVVSCTALHEWSNALASGLSRHGIQRGDRVAIGIPNSPALVAAILAVLRSGASVVPLNPFSSADEACYLLGDSGAKLLLTHSEQAKTLEGTTHEAEIFTDLAPLQGPGAGLPPIDPEDTALLVYTSGTTSRPKGVQLSHRALLTNLATVRDAWRWTSRDRLLLTLPCFHLHGLALGVLGSLLSGSSIVMRPRFSAEDVLPLLARHQCTMFFGVPTMYNRLVALPDEAIIKNDPSGMRLWVCGSAPLTASTFTRFHERFGAEILERFGTSEVGFVIATPYDGPRRAGAVGRPLPGIDLRFVDPDAADEGRWTAVPPEEPGEILVRGGNLFSGYWQRPEETQRAFLQGFYRTGDMAVREADGMIRIVGRRSLDIIKSRAFKISAIEIENCLQDHPGITEVAVVGIPDPDLGEAIVAVATPVHGLTPSEEDLLSFARARLAAYKVPTRFVFVDEIPRTGPGKFKKRELIAQLTGTTAPD